MSQYELEIRKLLLADQNDIESILSALLPALKDPATSPEDSQIIENFILNSGYYKVLLAAESERISLRRPVHWGLLIEALAFAKVTPTSEILEAFFKGVRKLKGEQSLLSARSWDIWDERFPKQRERTRQELVTEAETRRAQLKERILFLQSQRMIDEEERALELYLRMYPDDQEMRRHQTEFKERWARGILARRSSSEAHPTAVSEPTLSSAERQFAEVLKNELIELAEKNPDRGYDFAVLLFMMDLFPESLSVISIGRADAASEWLKAEILLKNRRFVQVMEHLNHLEAQFQDDPETSFAAAYLRAYALHGLGQGPQAVEILRSIVNVRPNYRSAHSLISKWSEIGSPG